MLPNRTLTPAGVGGQVAGCSDGGLVELSAVSVSLDLAEHPHDLPPSIRYIVRKSMMSAHRCHSGPGGASVVRRSLVATASS